jgi:peptidoglycan/xylan/chitin deacetylase (PgdA/CDA1 family)
MIRNFLFHRVSPERDELWDPMDVALFERCIRYISSKYNVVLFEDLINDEEKLNSNAPYATIMFDDGYKDNIEFASPILEKYNVKASFYVVTDCIDKNIPTWTHTFEHLFQKTQITHLRIDFDFLPEELHVTDLPTRKERLAYAKKLKPFLKNLPSNQRSQVLERVKETYTDCSVPRIMMNWHDLKALKQQGHYIGSHTVSHNMLATISNEEEIQQELAESAMKIELQLGHFPETISYPIGSYDERVKRLSRKVGYRAGLAVHQDWYNPKIHDSFEIRRIELYNEPWWKTKLRITNSLERIKTLIKYK